MSYELNVKELNGDWDSIVAIRGKKGDTGTPGTIFTVDAHYVEGDDVVAIADFTTNNNGVVNTQTIYAPTSGGGGTQVVYTEGTQIADGTTVGTITVNGTAHAIKVPSKVSDLTNDSAFITEDDIPTVPTKTSDLTNDSNFVTNNEVNYSINSAKTSVLQSSAGLIASAYSSETSYSVGDYVYYAMSVMGGTSTPQIYRCKVACSNVLPTNSQYWESVTIANELKNNKYMPNDEIDIGILYMYSASTGSNGTFWLDKPLDDSVTGAIIVGGTNNEGTTASSFTMRGAGKTVTNPTITVSISDDRKRLNFNTSSITTSNNVNVVSWVKIVFSAG